MNIGEVNYSKIKLERYVKKICNGQLSDLPLEVVGHEALRLLFAYRRHERGLHLRWNREESNHLALLTVEELKGVKKTDPVLNGIYDALVLYADGDEKLVQKLLETAENRINEISSSQRAKAKLPRTQDPVIKRTLQHVKRNPGYEPWEIVALLKNDIGSYGITDYDDEYKTFSHVSSDKKGREQYGTTTLGAVRNVITRMRKIKK